MLQKFLKNFNSPIFYGQDTINKVICLNKSVSLSSSLANPLNIQTPCVGEDGKYLFPEKLVELYRDSIGNIKPEDVIVHCGSGVTACHTLLAGITEPKLYVGSWSEWSRRDLPSPAL